MVKKNRTQITGSKGSPHHPTTPPLHHPPTPLHPFTPTPLFFSAHDPHQLSIWQKSTIGIAGAGGLGSNIAFALCRAGIGKLIIADFDTVSPSNLNRQQYFQDQIGLPKVTALKATLERISPFTQMVFHQEKITPDNLASIFGSVDILLEAFDLAAEKAMLLSTWEELYPDKAYIGASGLAGVGNNEAIHTEQFGNIYMIGDAVSELAEGISPVSARIAIVANMQANLCLELLLKAQVNHE